MGGRAGARAPVHEEELMPGHQVPSGLNGLAGARRARFVFLQHAWVLIVAVCAAAAILVQREHALGLAFIALIAAAPAFLGMVLNDRIASPLAQCAIVFAWTLMASVATALSGGALSPLAALFLIAPLLVGLVWEDEGFALVAAVFSALGYAVASAAGVWGLAPAGAQLASPAAQFGALAAILMTAAFALARNDCAGASHLAGVNPNGVRAISALNAPVQRPTTAPGVESHVHLRLDRDGMIAAVVGGAASALFGRDDRDVVGRPLGALVDEASASAVLAAVHLARDGGKPNSTRAEIAWPDGQRLGAVFGFEPDRTGGVTGHVRGEGVLRAAPASAQAAVQPRAPSQVIAAPMNATTSDGPTQNGQARTIDETGMRASLIGEMGHELKTPLNAIMGFADIMKEGVFGPLSDQYRDYVGHILGSGRHMQEVIAGALDLARAEAGKYDPVYGEFDIGEALQEAIDIAAGLRPSAATMIALEVAPRPLLVSADRRAMRQIALNLISNALKFTPADGQVHVAARADAAPESDFVELVVRDTGPGIAPEDLARLGAAFEQSAEEAARGRGTGLGLSIVRALAEGHGGYVKIASVLGEGATVTVRLPVRKRG